MILVGPSLGASVAIDFAVSYPFAVSISLFTFLRTLFTLSPVIYTVMSLCIYFLQVEKLVLINASVYAEGTKGLAEFPRVLAYAGVSVHIRFSGRICF